MVTQTVMRAAAGSSACRSSGSLALTCRPMSKKTAKRKLSAKKKANHGTKPNAGRG
ncbi:MAG: hypothetical protein ACRD0J_14765 [Acidimicrobiales bacterium]